jgi:hypothetical protein
MNGEGTTPPATGNCSLVVAARGYVNTAGVFSARASVQRYYKLTGKS